MAFAGFVLFAIVAGTAGGLVVAAVSRPGPWILVLLVPIVALVTLGRRAMGRAWRPVGDLIDATVRVGEGEFGVRVDGGVPGPLRPVVSSFNRMAERLDDEDERRRRFLADVGHELKTPLTVLRGEIEALVDGVRPADRAHLVSLLEDVDTLERLVEDLRILTLAESGRLELQFEPVDLGVLVRESLDSAAGLVADHGVATDLEISGEVTIAVDPSRMRQIVWNLVTNALRAMPEGGELQVRVLGDFEAVNIVFTDTGRGIDEDRLGTLFDRFEKSADSQGSGLGLTIVRDLVEAHGGHIAAGNDPAGGARFEIALPRRMRGYWPGSLTRG